jgi:sugar phosphate isomerase/epimerase
MQLAFIGSNDLPGLELDAAFAANHGFAGLEFNWWGNFKDVTEEHIRAMRAVLDRHGVGCCSLGLWGWNHTSPDAAERAAAHEMLDRAIAFGEILGAYCLIAGGGQVEGGIAANAAAFAEVFPPFLDRMARAGMKSAFYAVHGNSFFTTLAAYEAVWETLPQVGIKYDPANWDHAGQDYLEVVHRHGDKVAHVHIKEHLNLGDELASQPAAGMGDIAFGKVMAFLYEHDYRGYLCFEPHGALWGREPLRQKMLLLTKKHLDQFLV